VSTGPGEAPVPAVVGMPRDEAEQRVRDAGFDVRVEQRFSEDVARGRVISVAPAEGTVIERGSTVTLRVSRGRERIEVPDVVGDSEENARSALEGAGLQVTVESRETADADPGTVLEQDPAAAERVTRGTTVTITVAEEPPDVAIPDVLGEQADAAEAALDDAGFDVRVREQDTEAAEDDGVVIDQNPPGGEERPAGTRVTIVVGRLVEPEATPTPTPTPTPTVAP
jgi:serine/threonine-protein kinase